MNEPADTPQTSISKARTLEAIADFWDRHNPDDYWDQTREAAFEVRAQHRWRIALDPDVYTQVAVRAQARGILPETLVNLWLLERLQTSERV